MPAVSRHPPDDRPRDFAAKRGHWQAGTVVIFMSPDDLALGFRNQELCERFRRQEVGAPYTLPVTAIKLRDVEGIIQDLGQELTLTVSDRNFRARRVAIVVVRRANGAVDK